MFEPVGLAWQMTQLGRRWTGYDVEGNEFAFAVRRGSGEWDVYIWPIGCGDPKGVWLRGAWSTAEDATDIADCFVVGYIDCVDVDVDVGDESS